MLCSSDLRRSSGKKRRPATLRQRTCDVTTADLQRYDSGPATVWRQTCDITTADLRRFGGGTATVCVPSCGALTALVKTAFCRSRLSQVRKNSLICDTICFVVVICVAVRAKNADLRRYDSGPATLRQQTCNVTIADLRRFGGRPATLRQRTCDGLAAELRRCAFLPAVP